MIKEQNEIKHMVQMEKTKTIKVPKQKAVYLLHANPLFFIYQNGFNQISLPPIDDFHINTDVIQITSCDDGLLITTDIPLEEAKAKLNLFKGRKIVYIYCDQNEIQEGGIFNGCEITNGNYGERVLMLDWIR